MLRANLRGPRAALALAAFVALAAACTPPPPRPPESQPVPVVNATEDQDEWLHDHCAFHGLVAAPSRDVSAQAAAQGATLGELIYDEGPSWHVALFACHPHNPPWVAEATSSAWARP